MANIVAVTMLVASTAANAAVNASIAARKKRNGRNKAVSEEEIIEKKCKKSAKEILEKKYFSTEMKLRSQIDASKTQDDSESIYVEKRYFDKDGDLLIKESGWCANCDKEITTELYSKKNGQIIYSNRCYSDSNHVINHIDCYDENGVCNTELFCKEKKEEMLNEIKRTEQEAKENSRKAKQRLCRMKVKKFCNGGMIDAVFAINKKLKDKYNSKEKVVGFEKSEKGSRNLRFFDENEKTVWLPQELYDEYNDYLVKNGALEGGKRIVIKKQTKLTFSDICNRMLGGGRGR